MPEHGPQAHACFDRSPTRPPRVALVVCLADLDEQFEFGLEALLAGLEA